MLIWYRDRNGQIFWPEFLICKWKLEEKFLKGAGGACAVDPCCICGYAMDRNGLGQ